jgi:hypothetical protein
MLGFIVYYIYKKMNIPCASCIEANKNKNRNLSTFWLLGFFQFHFWFLKKA